MVVLDGGWLGVTALCGRRKDPVGVEAVEARRHDRDDATRHRNPAAGVHGLAEMNFDDPVTDVVAAKTKTLLGPEPAVQQRYDDVAQDVRIPWFQRSLSALRRADAFEGPLICA